MMSNNEPKLAIIVPCFNEQEVLQTTAVRLLEVLGDLKKEKIVSEESFIYFVDDGSSDDTFKIIEKLHENNKNIKALKFTRNFGNQNAILAGMLETKKMGIDCTITIDADLQQDENVIKNFVLRYKEGNEIVLGIRENLQHTIGKNLTSALFYKIMWLLGAKITPNHSEYRLVGKRALEVLEQYREYHLFLRGILTEIGFKKAYVPYFIKKREAGESKFNARSLVKLAVSAITSFSVVPLKFVSILGFLMAFFSFAFALEVLWEKYFLDGTVPGWTTIVVSVCFLSGVQIFCLGIVGEYLGRVYSEVKARPRYIKEIELK